MEDKGLPERVLNGKIHNTRPIGKPKNKTERSHPEGYFTDPRKTWTEETSRRVRRTEVSSEGDQGPEEAKAP